MVPKRLRAPLLAAPLCLLLACGGGDGASDETTSEPVDDTSGGEAAVVIIDDGGDDPRVSSSAGEAGGVVVMWPRIMGFAGEEAATLQARMVQIAQRVFGGAPVDVRPDPERVCPRGGCEGVSLGALLVVQDGSCLTVAIIGRPGEGDLTLVPWTGSSTVDRETIAFRDPPESHVTVEDRSACADLSTELADRQGEIEAALRAARP